MIILGVKIKRLKSLAKNNETLHETRSQRFDNWISRVGIVLFDGKSACPNETTWR